MNDEYIKLHEVFVGYNDKDWYALIENVLEFKPLSLPVVIDSGLPDETLSFINDFILKVNQISNDIYVKNLIDYYSTLAYQEFNIKQFQFLHNVFAKIKPTKFRYILEKKFTSEVFLKKYKSTIGEELQIDLLATISNLRYVENEVISSYLYNRCQAYSLDKFSLISLRYFHKAETIESYYGYLNSLVKSKLSQENSKYFIDAFKELVFLNKNYKILYDWVKNQNNNENYNSTLKKTLSNWLNLNNKHVKSEEYPYSKLLFLELNISEEIPSSILDKLSSLVNEFPLIKRDLKHYYFTEIKEKNENIIKGELTSDELNAIEISESKFLVLKHKVEEDRLSFTFDMPSVSPIKEEMLKQEQDVLKFDLSDDTNMIEVSDHVEVIPVTEIFNKGVTRYSLDDYMEEQTDSEKNIEQEVETNDPFNATIEENLKARVDERRRKLKEFNYKFDNAVSRIEEIEKQPAYKRAGIELSEPDTSEEVSRTSLGKDSNDDTQLRNNNEFLHDNVD